MKKIFIISICCMLYFSCIASAKNINLKSVPVLKTNVTLGDERIDEFISVFKGKRVGLITNATGIDKNYRSVVTILKEKTNLVALFTPEHGFLGNVAAAELTSDEYNSHYQLPVHSLYGVTRKPTEKMLEDIDLLVFDIQDVGTRHYTYMSTLIYAMQACAKYGKEIVVLDRPNPIGGNVEGVVLKEENSSFIGVYPLPLRHGMTIGEMALMFNTEEQINSQLTVIPMNGWKRDLFIDETNVPWVQTSPNIPTTTSALAYTATGIIGSVQASEGIGTTQPFEFVGMPDLDAYEFADTMNAYKFSGVYFRPIAFTPRFGNFQGVVCNGVQLHITDVKMFKPTIVGATLLKELQKHYEKEGDFWRDLGTAKSIDLHFGESSLRNSEDDLPTLLQRWQQEADDFKTKAQKYYLYK